MYSDELVTDITQRFWAVTPKKISSLGSCQDVNFKITSTDDRVFVLKISHSSSTLKEIEFQNTVMEFFDAQKNVLRESVEFPVLQSVLGTNLKYAEIELSDSIHFVRLLTFVHGEILSEFKYLSAEVLHHIGSCFAELNLILSGLSSTNADRDIAWDSRRSESVISSLITSVEDPSRFRKLNSATNDAASALLALKPHLRSQVVHGDLALYNIVAKRDVSGRPRITGIIDFCDAMYSWIVGDLAAAIASCFEFAESSDSCLLTACHILKGFHSIMPLKEEEIDALWPLIVLRNAVNIVIIQDELRSDPTNEYNNAGLAVEWIAFEFIAQISIDRGQQAFREAVRIPLSSASLYKRCIDSLQALETPLIQLAITDESIIPFGLNAPGFTQGNWKSLAGFEAVVMTHISEHKTDTMFYIGSYGMPRLYLSVPNSLHEPRVVPLYTDLFLQSGIPLIVPTSCRAFCIPLVQTKWTGQNMLKTASNDEELVLIILNCDGFDILIRGPIQCEPNVCSDSNSTEALLSAGDVFGHVICKAPAQNLSLPINHITVQIFATSKSLSSQGMIENLPPDCCTASMFPLWSNVCPDPMCIIGAKPMSVDSSISSSGYTRNERKFDEFDGKLILENRKAHVASIQEHYFKRRPPQIERAWMQFMYDSNCRAYLDVVNNVTVLGHCHPAPKAAAMKQFDLLNTNSRFMYSKLGEYAKEIIDTMGIYKDKLNVVFFVNSGSEATDLALRLARTVVTERRRKGLYSAEVGQRLHNVDKSSFCRDVICMEGGYHGVTTASDEVTTTLNDNPRALSSRPPWIHLAPMPNLFRGKFNFNNTGVKDPSTIGQLYANAVTEMVSELLEKGVAPAAFIAEPLSGNAGGVEIPPGYLKAVYSEMRSVGALCICDEVQVGFGRLGNSFWGFEEHDVIPDILTMAKAAGNGHPIGFVITSREIADEFGADGSFFSSAGGGPVSCAVGISVIRTIKDELLQENAKEIGEYLRKKLLQLVDKYPNIVGCIHGHGLYMGIELIRKSDSDDSIFEPATAYSYAICERLLELGVICHNTGDYSNVLKVKPPLCLNKENADFFVAALDKVFGDGW